MAVKSESKRTTMSSERREGWMWAWSGVCRVTCTLTHGSDHFLESCVSLCVAQLLHHQLEIHQIKKPVPARVVPAIEATPIKTFHIRVSRCGMPPSNTCSLS